MTNGMVTDSNDPTEFLSRGYSPVESSRELTGAEMAKRTKVDSPGSGDELSPESSSPAPPPPKKRKIEQTSHLQNTADYSKWNVPQLQEQMKSRHLEVSETWTKAELVARLEQYDAGKENTVIGQDSDYGDDVSTSAQQTSTNYNGLTIPQLKKELKNRHLKFAGRRKPELVAQLEQYDANNAGSPVAKSTASVGTSLKNRSALASASNSTDIVHNSTSRQPSAWIRLNQAEPVHDEGRSNVSASAGDLIDMFNPVSFDNGPDKSLPPMSDLPEIFSDIAKNAWEKIPEIRQAVQQMSNHKLRVATMCSGTESPVIALNMLFDWFKTAKGINVHFEHVFSAEIEPFKQAFIELNFSPGILFRDIIEMAESMGGPKTAHKNVNAGGAWEPDKEVADNSDGKATTAFGARKEIPKDIDILIAGFSCVDLSNLNRNKVALKDLGESGDTLRAIVAYASQFRPSIIVLENVDGAPWESKAKKSKKGDDSGAGDVDAKDGESIAEMFFAIGYYCQMVRLDTKNYYIPHTRCRGYMVCVDMQKMSSNPFNPSNPGKKYVFVESKDKVLGETMAVLERKASEPVEAFLLPESDPRIANSTEVDSQVVKAVNWGTCEGAHSTYRVANGLGMGKPITRWTLGGSSTPHEWIHSFIRSEVERVKDSLDILYLRNLRRGFDSFAKNRIIDLSQNIDRRSIDCGQSGYTGCVTPSGMPFSTTLGRLFTAEEALKLQGMDPDSLNVSLLSQRQLKELAGNAMTCPVVGTVILAAFGFCHRALRLQECLEADAVATPEKIIPIGLEGPFPIDLKVKNSDLSSIMRHIQGTLRHCDCEGQTRSIQTGLMECRDCGHKVCTKHSPNPIHNYFAVEPQRFDPATVISELVNVLPMSLNFEFRSESDVLELMKDCVSNFLSLPDGKGEVKDVTSKTKPRDQQKKVRPGPNQRTIDNFFSKNAKNSQADAPDDIQDNVAAIGSSFNDFERILRDAQSSGVHFRSVDRGSSSIIVNFESGDDASGALRLQLILTTKCAEWKLFLKTPKHHPVGSPLRALLDQPIARMQPAIHDIMVGQWELRVPKVKSFDVAIQGVGERIPCFEFTQGLNAFRDVTIWNKLKITAINSSPSINGHDISGEYSLSQKCSTAMGVLYTKKGSDSQDPIYLFLDPSRYGNPEHDTFVFALDTARVGFREVRSILASLDPSWRPNSGAQDWSDRTGVKKGQQFLNAKQPDLNRIWQPVSPIHHTVKCAIPESWEKIDGQLRTLAHGTYSHIPEINDLGQAFPDDCFAAASILEFTVYANRSGIPDTNGWKVINSRDLPKFWSKLRWVTQRTSIAKNSSGSQDWISAGQDSGECHVCVAPLPQLKWKFDNPKWTSSERMKVKKNKYKDDIIDEVNSKKKKQVLVPFEDPEESIKYERVTKARPSPFVVEYLSSKSLEELIVRVGVNPRTLIHQAAATLPKVCSSNSERVGGLELCYRLSTDFDSAKKAILPPFSIRNNEEDLPASKPPSFTHDLYLHQARSLTWMISQEQSKIAFNEERVVEAAISDLQWRLEGRAARKIQVRGGILADQVGYGKTILSLGLFDTQFERQEQPALEPTNGLIEIRATLILVPHHLVKQWKSEFNKFLGADRYNLMVISNVKSWKEKSIADFMAADAIICSWSLIAEDEYVEKVADFSGMLQCPDGAGLRAKNAWHAAARIAMRNSVYTLAAQEGPTKLLKKLAADFAENWAEAESNSSNKPSERLKGQRRRDFMMAKATKNHDDEDNNALDEDTVRQQFLKNDTMNLKHLNDWKNFTGVPLENFKFHRKILDEFSYVLGQQADTVAHIPSICSWFLSGTPGLRDYYDVWSTMTLMGIDLGQPPLTPGVISAQNMKTVLAEQTESEKFRGLLVKPTSAWWEGRYEYAQNAINTFIRQNATPIENISRHKHIVSVALPAVDRAIYSELALSVAASDMKEKKQPASVNKLDRERRQNDVWKKDPSGIAAPTAVGALMKCNLANDDVKLDDLIFKRRKDLAEVKRDLTKYFQALQYLRFREPKDTEIHKYYEFCDRLKRNEVGDYDASKYILRLIIDHEQIPNEVRDGAEEDFRVDSKKSLSGLRPLTTKTRDLCKRLVAAERGLRFMRSVKLLLDLGPISKNAKGKGKSVYDPDEYEALCPHHVGHEFTPAGVFVECGHIYCQCQCDGDSPASHCSRDFCNPPSGYFYALSRDELLATASNTENKVSSDGKGRKTCENVKMDKIAALIKSIGEKKVLLFYQSPEQRSKIQNVLKANKIGFVSLVGGDAGSNLDRFRNDAEKKVLVLSIDDVSAAGSNLTAANHVIFVTPYLAASQVKYETAMTQAIGRVCRYTQDRDVHIYHFIALNTVDVDVLETRTNCVLMDEGDIPVEILEIISENDEWKPTTPSGIPASEWSGFGSGLRLIPKELLDGQESGEYSSKIRNMVVECMEPKVEQEAVGDAGDEEGDEE